MKIHVTDSIFLPGWIKTQPGEIEKIAMVDMLKAQLGFSNVNIGPLNAIYSLPIIVMTRIGGIKSQLHG